MRSTRLFLFLILFCFGIPQIGLQAQTKKTRAQLEKEKTDIQKRLAEFDQILKRTAETKKSSIGQLNAVNKQLQTRISFINTLSREVSLLNTEIKETENAIGALEKDLENLKEEYSGMIYTSSKLNSGLTMTAFIFSSTTFKQFYMRLKYLKQYSDARKKQVELINKKTEELAFQRKTLEEKKSEKQLVLNQEQQQKQKLDQAKKEQQGIVNDLSKQEQDLRKKNSCCKKTTGKPQQHDQKNHRGRNQVGRSRSA
jgi:septal ring factor EnvC (AmiA/AmiB activator)